jgi:hypothetical protein
MSKPESSEFHGLEHQIPVCTLYLKTAKTCIANLTYRSHPHGADAIISDSRKSWVYHIWTSPHIPDRTGADPWTLLGRRPSTSMTRSFTWSFRRLTAEKEFDQRFRCGGRPLHFSEVTQEGRSWGSTRSACDTLQYRSKEGEQTSNCSIPRSMLWECNQY